MKLTNPIALLLGWIAVAIAPASTLPAAERAATGGALVATGSLSGTVTNVATGRNLDGALVEVAGSGRTAVTDADGRYIGENIATYNAASPALDIYRYPRTMLNLGLGWQFRPSANLFCEISNVLNKQQRRYMYDESRLYSTSFNGTVVNAGITGRF